MNFKVLITGVAGFIGFHLAKKLLHEGFSVVGIDNLNNYYDPELKHARLAEIQRISKDKDFSFMNIDLIESKSIHELFKKNNFEIVVNLAAQAGVRHSIEKPMIYSDSNILGFLNILEACRKFKPRHLLFASSSSVYGMNTKSPFSTLDNTDFPISLYAATKKSNELMAHAYSHLYDIPITGMRFFTVYGPFGRPDMAYFKFTKSIINGKEIEVYNHGNMQRDFTYIDDIIFGISKLIHKIPELNSPSTSHAKAKFKIYNIGNNNPITLIRFIESIEKSLGIKAKKKNLPMQSGDVPITYANIDDLVLDINFSPTTDIEEGIGKFVNWYIDFYKS